MGLDDSPDDRHHHHHQHHHQVTSKERYHTEHKKREKHHRPQEKFATAPAEKSSKEPDAHCCQHHLDKNNKIFVSLISQSEYMKRHLYIKTGVDRDRGVLRYQVKKVSLRNYTPKAIDQEMNMGMWI